MAQPPSHLPLQGITVVEHGHSVSAPYCARLLGDAGAQVVKVEPPQGDPSRRMGPFPNDVPHGERSGLFHYLNTGKLGITLDLGIALGRRLLRELLQQADIFVEDNPPQVMKEWGLDWESCHRVSPRLIVISITPFGQTGPYRDYQADELVLASMGGVSHATPGFPDQVSGGPEEPPLAPAVPLAQLVSGVTAAAAAFMALSARNRDGNGRHVDLSQQATVASLLTWDIATASYLGMVKGRPPALGRGLMANAYIPCKDGYVAIVAFSDHHWRELVHIMGDPEWAQSPLFETGASRAEYWDAILPNLLEWTMARTRQEIFQMTQSRGLPCFPAYEVDETVDTAHVKERRFLQDLEMDGVQAKMPGLPFRLSFSPTPTNLRAPRLGEHTARVLRERLGYDGQAIARMRATGAI